MVYNINVSYFNILRAKYTADGSTGVDELKMDGKTNVIVVENHAEIAVHNGIHYYMEGYTELDRGDTF